MTTVPQRIAPARRPAATVTTYAERRRAVRLNSFSRHVVSRFSGGYTPQLAAQVDRAGGGRAWFEDQLRPNRIADPIAKEIDGWFPSVRRTPAQIFQRHVDEVQGSWEVGVDLSRWTVARRIHSNRQLHEVMVDFWSNLLNVALSHEDAVFWRVDYDRVIRAHALTSFEQLLQATITHPAMGLFLDNAFSSKEAPNENLGRELLELHTVGVDGGYDEADVKASARMLTGYRVDVWWPSFRSFYDPAWHDTQPVRVMDFRHTNDARDGRAATRAYLSYLARHPATAKRIAHRLCVRFVSDDPPPAIVRAVTRAYLDHDTAIPATLRTLVNHRDFARSAGEKVRTPMEDYIASVRSLGIQLRRPTRDSSFARAMYWQYSEAGAPPYEWPAPNGYPEAGAAWASAGRVLTSFGVHRDLAARWWPTDEARFPAEGSLLPDMPATLETIIDHQAQRMFGRKATQTVRTAIAQLLGRPLSTRLTREQALEYWTFKSIVTTLLDSPLHLHR